MQRPQQTSGMWSSVTAVPLGPAQCSAGTSTKPPKATCAHGKGQVGEQKGFGKMARGDFLTEKVLRQQNRLPRVVESSSLEASELWMWC